MGPYTAKVLAERRSAGMESGVYTVHPGQTLDDSIAHSAPVGERTRQLYETIGGLYAAVSGDGSEVSTFPATDELADFLDTVRRALMAPQGQSAIALMQAITRYERDRTGGRL